MCEYSVSFLLLFLFMYAKLSIHMNADIEQEGLGREKCKEL